MNDIERLEQWMQAKGLSVWDLAREMQLPRHTVYFVVSRRKKVTESFAKKFAIHFGWDLAVSIFVDHFAYLPELAGVQP